MSTLIKTNYSATKIEYKTTIKKKEFTNLSIA